jgi:uroporphyrinogen-III synthase
MKYGFSFFWLQTTNVNNTSKAIEQAGLTLDIKAPQPQAPSMVAALEQYLSTIIKRK